MHFIQSTWSMLYHDGSFVVSRLSILKQLTQLKTVFGWFIQSMPATSCQSSLAHWCCTDLRNTDRDICSVLHQKNRSPVLQCSGLENTEKCWTTSTSLIESAQVQHSCFQALDPLYFASRSIKSSLLHVTLKACLRCGGRLLANLLPSMTPPCTLDC